MGPLGTPNPVAMEVDQGNERGGWGEEEEGEERGEDG